MTKLSDYVFQFFKEKGIKHIFMLSGGGAMHLVDSVGSSGLEYICCQHEQAAAIAAEAYGQHTNNTGVCLTTSGPGATNAITGVTAGWLDSTPMFVISGQAKRSDLVGDTKVRQRGSQEVQIIEMVKPITKYAAQVMDPLEIRYHMERAYYEATHGRPGPVWLSIPLDVQAAMVDVDGLRTFRSPDDDFGIVCTDPLGTDAESKVFAEHLALKGDSEEYFGLEKELERTMDLLRKAKRPIFLAGNGIKLSGAAEAFEQLIETLHIPALTTWKAIDLMAEDEECYAGHPGTMGDRGANLILQSADLLISVGSRLDTSLTAYNEPHFGRKAKKVIVDIDPYELDRMKMEQMEVKLACDAKDFILGLLEKLRTANEIKQQKDVWQEWLAKARALREKYPTVTKEHEQVQGIVSTYYFIDVLCRHLTGQDVIAAESAGSAGEITYQAFKIKKGQKMKNAAGLGSMGFGLPYAIAACLANDGRRTILINGDGAFQLNIQELETLHRLNLPVKIFIWNNGGYASIRSMQDNIFAGRQVASGEESGLTMPDILKIAQAYGFLVFRIRNHQELEETIAAVLQENGPVVCEVLTSPYDTISPRSKTIKHEDGTLESMPLERMWPPVEEENPWESLSLIER